MSKHFPLLQMDYEQVSLLMAQLLVYKHYLQRKTAPAVRHRRALRVLLALLQRLDTLFDQKCAHTAFLLTVEEVAVIKEALVVLQRLLEAKQPSVGRDFEIQRLASIYTLVAQTFPDIQHD